MMQNCIGELVLLVHWEPTLGLEAIHTVGPKGNNGREDVERSGEINTPSRIQHR
jgi:hypothetical protein